MIETPCKIYIVRLLVQNALHCPEDPNLTVLPRIVEPVDGMDEQSQNLGKIDSYFVAVVKGKPPRRNTAAALLFI